MSSPISFKLFKNELKFLQNSKVYVGFSGGSDSTFLILLLHHYQKEIGYELTAVNFEHGIRGKESEEDTEFCKRFCNLIDVPIIVHYLHISKNTKNLECVARQKRLEWYNKNLPDDCVLVLGHQADDLIENFFIRMLRGSNLSGLMGLREITKYHDSNYIVYRPLLKYRKHEIQTFLRENGIEWRTDSTNFDTDYLRNFLRNEILNQLYQKHDGAFKGMFLCINNVMEDAEFIESYVDSKYDLLKLKDGVDVSEMRSFDDCIKHRIIKKFADDLGCQTLTKGFYREFDKLVISNSQHPKKLTSGSFEVSIMKNKIYFKRNDEK